MVVIKEKLFKNLTGTIQLSKNKIHHNQMMERLKEQLNKIPHNGKDTFTNTPVFVNKNYVLSTTHLCKILNTALQQIVANYFNDVRIRKIYSLDTELEAILKTASETSYKVGFYRPDFVYNTQGFPKICEIGCRFPVNGWMLSFYLNDAIQNLQLQAKNHVDKTAFLAAFTNRFSKEKPIYLVHDKELGTEIFYLLKELNSLGYQSYSISPKDIALKKGKLEVNNKPVSQFILEMDREELKTFNSDVLIALVKESIYINDVRSLILVHDKRILAVMYNEEIMSDYISKEEYRYLKQFLIPSYTLNSSEKRKEFINSNQNWILKSNSGGRGIDMHVKDDCNPNLWQDIIEHKWQKFMIQEFVNQKTFEFEKSPETRQNLHIVGMLLCYNNTSFGPGLFRGSSENIINLHQGRGVVLPCISTP